MKRKRLKKNVLYISILAILASGIFCTYKLFFDTSEVKEVKVIHKIKEYGYVLKDSKTARYKKMFYELESILKKKPVDEEKYVKKITKMFNLEKIKKQDYNYITNIRQISKIKECLEKVDEIEKGLTSEIPLDMIEIDLRDIWDILGEIVGENYSEELLDELFSKFCVGK